MQPYPRSLSAQLPLECATSKSAYPHDGTVCAAPHNALSCRRVISQSSHRRVTALELVIAQLSRFSGSCELLTQKRRALLPPHADDPQLTQAREDSPSECPATEWDHISRRTPETNRPLENEHAPHTARTGFYRANVSGCSGRFHSRCAARCIGLAQISWLTAYFVSQEIVRIDGDLSATGNPCICETWL
jgi:hypothetical protein